MELVMVQVLMALFNPHGDGTLRPRDQAYHLVTKSENLVTGTYTQSEGWKLTEHVGTYPQK